MKNHLKAAYEQGQTAESNGYERVSPYFGIKAEQYWLAGFDGVGYTEFNKSVMESRRATKSSLGYSRIGLNNT